MILGKPDIYKIQVIINKNLKLLRTSEKISQDQLAEMLEISRNTISLIELGKKPASPVMALAIYHIFKDCDLLKLVEQNSLDR
jgi:transcriptional regulator with XRE-family HTH domain